nr:immunoglobulin heavy chain junction region [Macaca mulatta]MOX38108.1 immunoglobulin heavy chain junction region [Macaca mulatta]MOX38777.1 immunoglobulin heavy chain junction region [Macaca mulatta]MOX38914.1 immunoglobulin heavy chain junction region [Macaca mulatta]MOX39046.1 immunoglobulin heavy chain junction region [Macaca mulatta]
CALHSLAGGPDYW